MTITVPARELGHILAHGANTLIRLQLEGDSQLTLARQIQRNPTRGDLVHVDFVRVRTDVAVSAEVAVHLLGEPEGVRNGGLLEQLVFSLPIEARPQDIRLTDLPLPSGVQATIEPDALIAQVVAPRVATAEEEAAEGAEGEAVEGEGAEAAAPAEGGEASGDEE